MNAIKLIIKKHRWVVAAVAGAQILALNATAEDTNNSIDDLKKQIQALTQKVDDLEARQKAAAEQQRQIAATQEKTSAKLTNAPFITAGAKGFSMQSADGDFILNLKGFAQVDSHYFASADPGKDTFTIRRMRAIASGSVYHNFEYYLQTDFASGISSTTTNNSFLQDAYVNVNYFPQLQVQAGKMKPPLSLEWVPLDQYLWFLERGFPSELVPNRDVGVMLHGDLFHGALSYFAGVFNGIPDNSSGDVAVADNEKDVCARIFALPFKNTDIVPLQKLGLGLGSSYGLQPGQTTPTFATMARQTFFSYSNNVSEAGQHFRFDPQAYYFWGPLGIYGEYVLSDTKYKVADKTPHTANFNNKAWDVVGSYFLTGEDNNWATLPDVHDSLRFGKTGWGAWQLAARIGQISLDPASFPLYAVKGSAEGATSWSVALNWYLNRNVKCIFEYSNTTFDGGNKTPGSVTGQTEQALLGRLQFGF